MEKFNNSFAGFEISKSIEARYSKHPLYKIERLVDWEMISGILKSLHRSQISLGNPQTTSEYLGDTRKFPFSFSQNYPQKLLYDIYAVTFRSLHG